MIMGPAWFEKAGEIMHRAAAERGRRFVHYLQTNLIGYSPAWNGVIQGIFNGSLGTSMDYPNIHRKLFKGGAAAYTELWSRRVREAKAAGIAVGVIAVLAIRGPRSCGEYQHIGDNDRRCVYQYTISYPEKRPKHLHATQQQWANEEVRSCEYRGGSPPQ